MLAGVLDRGDVLKITINFSIKSLAVLASGIQYILLYYKSMIIITCAKSKLV